MANNESEIAVSGLVSGKVQGVGFRYFVQMHAKKLGVQGFARNLPDGRVQVFLQGSEEGIWEMKKKVIQGPLLSSVTACEWKDEALQEVSGFFIA